MEFAFFTAILCHIDTVVLLVISLNKWIAFPYVVSDDEFSTCSRNAINP